MYRFRSTVMEPVVCLRWTSSRLQQSTVLSNHDNENSFANMRTVHGPANSQTEGLPPERSITPQKVDRSFITRFMGKSGQNESEAVSKEQPACLKVHGSDLLGRDFLSLKHFKKEDLYQFVWTAKDLKSRMKESRETWQPLKGVNAIGIFHPGNSESKLWFELGLAKLGGHTTILTLDEIQTMTNSNTKDTARLLSGMADLIIMGGYPQDTVDEMANESPVPVISASSISQHSVQTLAQFVTLQEYFGYLRGLNIAWVGVGSNVLNSLLYGCARLGIDFRAATPPDYEPDLDIMMDSMKIAGETDASFVLSNNPVQAVYRADAILTGPWLTSVSDTKDVTCNKLKDFHGFQINRKMLKEAGGDWVFMHSLPRQGQEVTDDVFYGQESLVQNDVENRMWVIMAVMLHLMKPFTPTIPMPKFVRG